VSVSQLRAIPEMKKYGLDLPEIEQVFERVPLDELLEYLGSVPPDVLYEFLSSYGVDLSREWFYLFDNG
jgi:hypothetical protein